MKKILLYLLLAFSTIAYTQGHRRSLLMNSNSGGAYSFEQALKFDGVDDYATTNQTMVGYNQFTVSIWFNTRAIDKNQTFLGNNNINFIKLNALNRLELRVSGSSRNFDLPALTINSWNHIAITRELNGDIRVYLNGVESTTGSLNDNDSFTVDFIGMFQISGSNFHFFDGKLDDVLISNIHSTATQISNLYNAGLGADPLSIIPSAQQLYRFNNNVNNDGSLGGSLTLNNFIADPYVTH